MAHVWAVALVVGTAALAPAAWAAPAQPRVALVQDDDETPVDKGQDLASAQSNTQGKLATYCATFGFGCGFCCGCSLLPPGCLLPVAALASGAGSLQVAIVLGVMGLGLIVAGLVLMGVNAGGYLTTILILNRMGLFDSLTAMQAMQDVFHFFSILWRCF